jgi:hypothetical protein
VLDTDRKGLPGNSKNEGDGGTGVYMREGSTSRVMAADRPYGEFYDFTASVRNIFDTCPYNMFIPGTAQSW